MAKEKKDAKMDSSPDPDANVDPSATIESDAQPDPTQEGIPEAGVEEPEIRDDAPLKNQIGELQRRLSDQESQNKQLLDSVFEMTGRVNQQTQAQAPQISPELQELHTEAETLGVGKPFVDKLMKAAQAMTQAQVQQQTQQNLPAMQSNIDMAQVMQVERIAATNPRITPFTDEIMDVLKQAPLQVRQQPGVVEQAVALVTYRHLDDIEKTAKQTAVKEASKRRKVDGDSLLSSTTVKVNGNDIALTPEVRDLAARIGKDDAWMAEAMASHEAKKAALRR